MPVPDEPREEDYESFSDYMDAVEQYVRLMLPPEEKAIRREVIMGHIKIREFLDDQSDPGPPGLYQ